MAVYCMIPTLQHLGKGKSVETVKRLSVCQFRGRDELVENRGFLGQ